MNVKKMTAKYLQHVKHVKQRKSENTYRFYSGRLSAFTKLLGHHKCRDERCSTQDSIGI